MKAYDSFTPPEYDVSKIKVPIALFVGADDMLADPTDAKELADKLNTLIHYETVCTLNYKNTFTIKFNIYS